MQHTRVPSIRAVKFVVFLIVVLTGCILLLAGHFLAPEKALWSSAGISLAALAGSARYLFSYNERIRRHALPNLRAQVYKSLFGYSPVPAVLLDQYGRVQEINEGASELIGYTPGELSGFLFADLLDKRSRQEFGSLFGKSLAKAPRQLPVTLLHRNGSIVHLQLDSTPVFVNGRVEGTLVIGHDNSVRKRDLERIRYMAYYDDMTGLPNRRLFMSRMDAAMQQASKQGDLIGLLYMDIDRFKLVNDSFGRDFGDMLLLQLAERMTRVLQEEDMVARMEGDEFAFLFSGVASEHEVLERSQALLSMLEEPFELQDFVFHVTASIGGAINRNVADDAGALMKKAEIALGKVKDSGRNSVILYEDDWSNSSLTRLTLQHELRQGLQRGEFVLHYQPQYHLRTGKIVGMEALVRWRHPERGMVPPGDFIPLAEDSGIIVQLGDWVLEEACRQNKAWQEAGLLSVPVSVNLSIRQFMQQNLADKIACILDRTGLEARYLEVEITETMTMDVRYANQCLLELTRLGIGISIDDFGTGYSSFNYLKNLPISKLKIDRSFVRDLEQDPGDAAIVAAIIAMAHNLNLRVIAEGVESEHQVEFLKNHNCDEMQGYYWSPPVASEKLEQLLQKQAG